MNIYARYFDHDILVHTIDELLDFLSGIPEIRITRELINDINSYAESDITYPKRYKVRPRVYFILIKTLAETLEEFKNHKNDPAPIGNNEANNHKEQRITALNEHKPGWYKGSLTFKRVIPIPATGKFQYQDTTFSALIKANSAQECYNAIAEHLKNRSDIDPRSQIPSAKGNNFNFTFVAPISELEPEIESRTEDLQQVENNGSLEEA